MATRIRPEATAAAQIQSVAAAAARISSAAAATTWLRPDVTAAVRIQSAVAAAARIRSAAAATMWLRPDVTAAARTRPVATAAARIQSSAAAAARTRPATTVAARGPSPASLLPVAAHPFSLLPVSWCRPSLPQPSPSSQQDKLICSHSSAPSLKVGCSSDSPFLLFPNRRNHAGFVIRVELEPSAQFQLTGLMLELLRFNDEPRGDPSLSPVMHTPKSTAQQQTSVLCRFRGGS
ncbi:Os04g0297800 [Oryza sativa Japonica Group]|uniref:Os04g0297800 protein n=1 Tax=Oryza sativa subsp. japonica TaxID=39947 RepID=C7J0W3_ORYSJ|nr:Os04g0297800 [Oryza sativa Japonica Group]|eukprot:NP_001173847.1 Os04g0297800 [Oryza sativa Japonica Group]